MREATHDGAARALARDGRRSPRGVAGARARGIPAAGGSERATTHADGVAVTASPRSRAAVEELAALESDPELARGLSLVAAIRALEAGDAEGARALAA